MTDNIEKEKRINYLEPIEEKYTDLQSEYNKISRDILNNKETFKKLIQSFQQETETIKNEINTYSISIKQFSDHELQELYRSFENIIKSKNNNLNDQLEHINNTLCIAETNCSKVSEFKNKFDLFEQCYEILNSEDITKLEQNIEVTKENKQRLEEILNKNINEYQLLYDKKIDSNFFILIEKKIYSLVIFQFFMVFIYICHYIYVI